MVRIEDARDGPRVDDVGCYETPRRDRGGDRLFMGARGGLAATHGEATLYFTHFRVMGNVQLTAEWAALWRPPRASTVTAPNPRGAGSFQPHPRPVVRSRCRADPTGGGIRSSPNVPPASAAGVNQWGRAHPPGRWVAGALSRRPCPKLPMASSSASATAAGVILIRYGDAGLESGASAVAEPDQSRRAAPGEETAGHPKGPRPPRHPRPQPRVGGQWK